MKSKAPFSDFVEQILPQSKFHSAVTAAYRLPESDILCVLIEQARLPAPIAEKTRQLACLIAEKLRYKKNKNANTGRLSHLKNGIAQNLLQEYSLSSQEGVALMCLAEALLRIPDKSTRDALIRDKISQGDWRSHLGKSTSPFVNAVTWGLLLAERLVSPMSTETNADVSRTHDLSSSLGNAIKKGGEPLIRKGLDVAMCLMGEQFVIGETITAALNRARQREAKGFQYSYDMLGEAALTKADALSYFHDYEQAIHAIGKASARQDLYEAPGISIKLSALHPRYCRAKYASVMDELYPVLKALTLLARTYNIGISIDAEESERLDLSLVLFEKLCLEPEFVGWEGLGFVVQAYQKRCPFVIDYLIDLAERSQHRLMIRLVKGAYWDSEIKRAQVEGLEGYPVFTRKCYTDVCYLACAQKLLAAPERIYPQFATHNAHTMSAIYHLAGENYYPGQYEFQCLHGMGEPLYDLVVGTKNDGKLDRPCRIYAPVGTHETLLAYLVRRLLENGANTSFVNRITDPSVSLLDLVKDPIEKTEALAVSEGALGLPHPKIPLPRDLYGRMRQNALGIDLTDEQQLSLLSIFLSKSAEIFWEARPLVSGKNEPRHDVPRRVCNPADFDDIVGHVWEATENDVSTALDGAVRAGESWCATSSKKRADILEQAAHLMEEQMQILMGILIREAGKTFSNAVAEVREAVDFLRYYAMQVREDFDQNTHRPLGPIVCISPWNFPLAIFTGQVAAALVTGNTVLAKPAEQTPLVAAHAIRLLQEAGIPRDAIQFLPGRGETVGNQLVSDPRIRGVMFTGSTAVAKRLQRKLAGRFDDQGHPVPLIAETGGINAMIVDSSALTEQVVGDVIASAFDSAGQRCSALRLLCLQDDIADKTLKMLRGAMEVYQTGKPTVLTTDIGPVIDEQAKAGIEQHIKKMKEEGFSVFQTPEVESQQNKGFFIQPTLIELNEVGDLKEEIFGPVLHVVRYSRDDLLHLIKQINATGYGLTFGLHTRIDDMIHDTVKHIKAGNLYVNRNIVGAVVGVQPFGGEGLSGTGPKAGGPLYLYRLLSHYPQNAFSTAYTRKENSVTADISIRAPITKVLHELSHWAKETYPDLLSLCSLYGECAQSGTTCTLKGPTGERDTYKLVPRNRILCLANNRDDALIQLAAVFSVGSRVLWPSDEFHQTLMASLPHIVQSQIDMTSSPVDNDCFDGVIYHGDKEEFAALSQKIADHDGPIIPMQRVDHGETHLVLEQLLLEHSLSVNTAAAGGDTSLMTLIDDNFNC